MERYEAYKDSGVAWIGEIPEGWEVRRVMTMLDRSSFGLKVGPFGSAIKDKVIEEGPYRMYGQANLIRRDFSYGDKFVNQSTYQELAAYDVTPGDVLVSVMGTIGKCSVVPPGIQPGIMDSHLIKLRLSEECVPRFFEYAYESDGTYEQLRCMSKGSIMSGLNSEMVKGVRLAAPGLTEQQAITDYLDAKTAEIDELVADCEREVGLLREYRKAVISEAVTKGLDPEAPMRDSGVEWIGEIPETWLCSSLSRVIKAIQTGPFGSQLHAEDYLDDGEVCVVNPANIIGGKIAPSSCNRISKDLADSLSQHLMHEGEIVFGRRGEMGRCALVEEDGLFCGTGSIEMELLETIIPSFAVYYLQCDFVKSYLELRSVGTTLQNLNTVIIASTPFVVAPIEEQRAIVAYLNDKTAEIDSLIEAKQSMADKLREYRRSLISEAVTGKFKVPGV